MIKENLRLKASYFSLLFILIILSPALNGNAAAQYTKDPRRIYDGRLSPKPGIILPSEQALLKQAAIPAARQWQKQSDSICTGNPEASGIDAALGSFTRPASVQRAILYRYCMTGHNKAVNGIAVIENGRLVAHIVYEGGWDNAIGAIPDLNGNGRSEIILASGGTNQGITWKSIAIIEFNEESVARFGRIQTFSDNCGVNENCRVEACRLSVKNGREPVFYREDFLKTLNAWGKPGPSRQISLDKDEIEYQIVK